MTSFPIRIVFDGLSGVDGSARFSFGAVTALASVSGPIAARLASEHPARATVDLHVRPLSAVPGTAEKHTAIALKCIFERACILAHHPRTLIQIVVQALSSSRDVDHDILLAAEINACSLALLNAGSVPMRGVVCGIAVAQYTAGGRPQIVTASNQPDFHYAGCFAFLFGVDDKPVEGQIPPSKMIWTNYRASPGRAFSAAALADAENVALECATAVWTKMKESLIIQPS